MASYKFEHTHLTSPDPGKAVEFYTKVIGARVIEKHGNDGREVTVLDLGGTTIRISNYTGADDNWKGLQYGLHHFGLIVDNLDEAAAEMKSKGVEFVVEPTEVPAVIKYAFIKAPDDVLIEVIEKK